MTRRGKAPITAAEKLELSLDAATRIARRHVNELDSLVHGEALKFIAALERIKRNRQQRVDDGRDQPS